MQQHVQLMEIGTGAQHVALLNKMGGSLGTPVVAAERVAWRTALSPSDCI